jgi:hypothetical protein
MITTVLRWTLRAGAVVLLLSLAALGLLLAWVYLAGTRGRRDPVELDPAVWAYPEDRR